MVRRAWFLWWGVCARLDFRQFGGRLKGMNSTESTTQTSAADTGSSSNGGLMSRISASADPNSDPKEVALSQEAYDRLSAELEDLTTRGRVEIARIIETARELGDLKENGDYHAAKEEQGKMEGRIRHLENLLEKAVVTADGGDGSSPGSDTVSSSPSHAVQVGSVVTIKYEGEDDSETFLLASVEESSGDYDLLSPQSPLGAALLGSSAGQQVSYEVPPAAGGKAKPASFTVEVLEVG